MAISAKLGLISTSLVRFRTSSGDFGQFPTMWTNFGALSAKLARQTNFGASSTNCEHVRQICLDLATCLPESVTVSGSERATSLMHDVRHHYCADLQAPPAREQDVAA